MFSQASVSTEPYDYNANEFVGEALYATSSKQCTSWGAWQLLMSEIWGTLKWCGSSWYFQILEYSSVPATRAR